MDVKEVLHHLKEEGINVNIRTLQRYAKKGLIPKPRTKSLGRGMGKESVYPKTVVKDFKKAYFKNKGIDYEKLTATPPPPRYQQS